MIMHISAITLFGVSIVCLCVAVGSVLMGSIKSDEKIKELVELTNSHSDSINKIVDAVNREISFLKEDIKDLKKGNSK